MNIGITGATGLLGFNILKQLQNKTNYSVKILIRKDVDYIKNSDADIYYGNLSDIQSLEKFCNGLDAVIHCAAVISIGNKKRDDVFKANVTGTENIVASCKKAKVKRFVHISSIDALIHTPLDIPLDENRPLALNSPFDYAKSKAIAEQFVLKQNSNDFQVVVLNPTAIIGSNDYKPSLIGKTIKNIIEDKFPALIHGGYNWVDVRDVAKAAVSAVENGKTGERYIISGEWMSLTEVARVARLKAGKKSNLPVLPMWFIYAILPLVTFFTKITGINTIFTKESIKILVSGNRNIKNEKAVKDLKFKPTPLIKTIEETVEWFI